MEPTLSHPDETVWSVGAWHVDPTANEVIRGGERLRLEPKAVEVLLVLARRAAQVVSREELLAAVWPGVVVNDEALTQAIIKLRKALGDDARRPSYIETISKRGYRLIAPASPRPAPAPAAPAREPQADEPYAEEPHADEPQVPLSPPEPAAASRWLPAGLLALLLIGAVAIAGWQWRGGAALTAPPQSAALPIIAVLPLVVQSDGAAREHLGNGIADDIIGALGRYSGLRVISRVAVDRYRQSALDLKTIRHELGARYVVTGSVREADGKLRIGVELSDADRGLLLWSERFERDAGALFEIQDRIVLGIVGVLAVKVSQSEQQRATRKGPRNLEAYDLVLRARRLITAFESDRAANRQARALLAQAQQLEPDYAEIEIVWAAADYQRAHNGWVEDPAQTLRQAEQHARRALQLADSGAHARAHGQLSLIHGARGEHELALAEAERAIAINPSDAVAFDARGRVLLWLGRLDEALAAMETAQRFDPHGRTSGGLFTLAVAYYSAGRYRDAVVVADAALLRHSNAAFLHAIRAAALAQLGEREGAQSAAQTLMRLDPFFPAREFGSRFVQREHEARLQDGLRKAGLL